MENYKILKWNAFELIKKIHDAEIQVVITSPPYNVGKEYEKRKPLEEYLHDYKGFADELYRIIKTNGSLFWQVGNYVQEWEIFPLDIFYYDIFKSAGFKLRNRIIWHFEHGLHASKRLSGRYETILWFTKWDEYIFHLDNIRVPSKYPGKLHFKWPNKWKPSGNPLGKNPSDIWKVVEDDWERGIWDIPNVKSNHPEKSSHPCQFPVELVQRCILATSNDGDMILDPFLGTGSSILGAILHNRFGMWFEMDSAYISESERRIQDFYNGELKIRPLGKPVYQPSGKEKSSINPFQ